MIVISLKLLLNNTNRRFLLVGGKGGVGKSSISASIATTFANNKQMTLIISTDPAHSLSDSFKQDLSGGEPVPIVGLPNLFAMEIDPKQSSDDFKSLANINKQEDADNLMSQLSQFGLDDLDGIFDTMPPGIDEALALAKVIQFIKSEKYSHFKRIIENTYLPISIYQLPQVVKCNIEPETLKILKDNFQDRIQLFKDTSGEDDVVNSGINFNDLIFLRGAEENYFDHLKPNGKYDGFLLSSANCFGKILREIYNNVAKGNFKDAEKMSEELSDIIRISFSEGQKLDFGNPFSNVNKAFAHVLINKDNLSCKTCFDRNIPNEFLNDMFLLLSKYNLRKSL